MSGPSVDYTNNESNIGVIRTKRKKLKLLRISDDAKRTRIKPVSGLIYDTVREYIFPGTEDEFDSGIGRMALFGKNNKKNCEADVFFNNDFSILFVAIYNENNKLVREFYLDHPNLKYSNILFQYMLSETNKAGKISKAAIVVERKDSAFKIVRNVKQVDFVFNNEDEMTEHCIFDMSLTQYYDGEQE